MLWVARLSCFFSAAMLMVVLCPSLQSFSPAEATLVVRGWLTGSDPVRRMFPLSSGSQIERRRG